MQPVLGQAGDDASRVHTESDLRIYLAWCAERSVYPLAVERAQVELYVRWMQEVRRFKPSTVSRWMSVVAGLYRTSSSTAYWITRAVATGRQTGRLSIGRSAEPVL